MNSQYRELASLIDDNDYLTINTGVCKRYIMIAKPDNEVIEEIQVERLKHSKPETNQEQLEQIV